MAPCEAEMAANVKRLVSSGKYSFCDVNDNLKELLGWFDTSESWIKQRWFGETSWNFSRINSGPHMIFTSQQLLFMVVSLLANVYIIFYHYRYPHHPKFSMTLLKKQTIAYHVVSGAVNVILPVYVFFSTNQKSGIACMFVFVFIDFTFSLSALKQTPNVYGVRSITVPLYYVCIACKVFMCCCLLQSLLYEPLGGYKAKVEWLWMCWVIHQTYAWVRIWYMTFFWADALISHQYTISVFLAGSMCVGASLGFYLWIVWILSLGGTYAYIHLSVRSVKNSSEQSKAPKSFSISEAQKRMSFLREEDKEWRETLQELYNKEGREKLSEKETRDKERLILKALEIAQMWEEAQPNFWRNSPEDAEEALDFLQSKGVKDLDRTPDDLKARVLFDFIDKRDKQGGRKDFITVQEFKVFLIGFGVSNVNELIPDMSPVICSVSDEEQPSDSACDLIDFASFKASFPDFYRYAFDGLCQWIDHANQKTDVSDIDNIVERVVKREFNRRTFLEAARPVRRGSRSSMSFGTPLDGGFASAKLFLRCRTDLLIDTMDESCDTFQDLSEFVPSVDLASDNSSEAQSNYSPQSAVSSLSSPVFKRITDRMPFSFRTASPMLPTIQEKHETCETTEIKEEWATV